ARHAADVLCKEELDRYQKLESELASLETRRRRNRNRRPSRALAVKEAGPVAPPTHVLVRGNAHAKGKLVEPSFPRIFGEDPPTIPAPREGASSSGRRRVFAEWVIRPDNPLTARVMVNRIWQHHFGRGIVPSANNFGRLGDPPTHPELLDWLASELVRQGYSLKKMHRLIVTSSAYKMSSAPERRALEVDPQNLLFWRVDARRLEAEAIRDAILATNGKLELSMGGPGFYPEIPQVVLQGQSQPGSGWGSSSERDRARRSIYIHVK